jgi:chromosome segregation protein
MYEKTKQAVDEVTEKGEKLRVEKEAILNMIGEIEKKKMVSFMETFNAVNTYFNKYFRELYHEEGSFASIKLEEPEKPLESGLLIEAKPAGKTLKNIDSMSGGEKSLTALAFLFAIQAHNPSPFYILDEIDAALDMGNSERVARMLDNFAKDLQFIIITHNNAIVQKSDQIIGVHMGKDGSSVVEVDLKSYQVPAGAAEKADRLRL